MITCPLLWLFVSCSNVLAILCGLFCLEKWYHDSALQYQVYHQVKIILLAVAVMFRTDINLHVNGTTKFRCFLLHNLLRNHAVPRMKSIKSVYCLQIDGSGKFSIIILWIKRLGTGSNEKKIFVLYKLFDLPTLSRLSSTLRIL